MAAPATKQMTAAEIAAAVGGTLSGDGSTRVGAVAPLDAAGAVLVTAELAGISGKCRTRIVVAKPYDALVALLPRFYATPAFEAGVHQTAVLGSGVSIGAGVRIDAFAVIGDNASIGDGAWIGPHCEVGDGVSVGANARLYSHVTAYPGTRIGDRTAIHAGVRLGSDGFGYAYRDGAHQKIPHVGRCIIGNDVEIGANSAIDRGSIDDTVVGDGTKIDNLVHIAHNVRIGRLCLLMAQVGVAGSVRIEDGAILAGQAGVSGHHTIGKGATVAARAGVFGNVPPGETWSGYPARPHRDSLRSHAALFKLAEFMKRVERLLDKDGK